MRFFTTLITSGMLLGILTCTSCSFKQQQVLFKQQTPLSDTSRVSHTGSGTSDYRIHSQDVLQIRNLQSTRFIVDEGPSAVTGGGGGAVSQGQMFQVEDDGTV